MKRKIISFILIALFAVSNQYIFAIESPFHNSENPIENVDPLGIPDEIVRKSDSNSESQVVTWINEVMPVPVPIELNYSYDVEIVYSPTTNRVGVQKQNFIGIIKNGKNLPFSSNFNLVSARVLNNNTQLNIFGPNQFTDRGDFIYSPSDIANHGALNRYYGYSAANRIKANYMWTADDSVLPAVLNPSELSISF